MTIVGSADGSITSPSLSNWVIMKNPFKTTQISKNMATSQSQGVDCRACPGELNRLIADHLFRLRTRLTLQEITHWPSWSGMEREARANPSRYIVRERAKV